MRVIITAFEARARAGTEAGLAWQWASAYQDLGHDVCVYSQNVRDPVLNDHMWADRGIQFVRVGEPAFVSAPQGVAGLVKARLTYRKWVKRVVAHASGAMSEADIVHHVSWGSVRLRPPFPQVDGSRSPTFVWGPLGGGQHAIYWGLRPAVVLAEVFRSVSFKFERMGIARWLKQHENALICLATNDETLSFIHRVGAVRPLKMLADGVVESAIIHESRARSGQGLRLIWLGRFVSTKRPDLAVRVVAELLRRGIPTTIQMVGDGPQRAKVMKLARRMRVEASCFFPGRLDWASTDGLYDQADLLLFHSMRDSSCPTVLEAAARGVPTVGLRVHGLLAMVPPGVAFGPEVMHGTRRFVSSAADACIALLDPDRYEAASNAAMSFANTQIWSAKATKVLQLIAGDRD